MLGHGGNKLNGERLLTTGHCLDADAATISVAAILNHDASKSSCRLLEARTSSRSASLALSGRYMWQDDFSQASRLLT